jgi:hypothetical protein
VLTVLRAGRSVWYDRHVGIVEAAGSNPAQSTIALHESTIFAPSFNPFVVHIREL